AGHRPPHRRRVRRTRPRGRAQPVRPRRPQPPGHFRPRHSVIGHAPMIAPPTPLAPSYRPAPHRPPNPAPAIKFMIQWRNPQIGGCAKSEILGAVGPVAAAGLGWSSARLMMSATVRGVLSVMVTRMVTWRSLLLYRA